MARHSLSLTSALSRLLSTMTTFIDRPRRRVVAALLFFALIMLPASTVNAAFHFWQIKEVFSNADGSVQFIEMFNSNPNENDIGLYSLTAESETAGNTVSNDFVFPDDLSSGDTAGRHLLIATTGFGSLPGAVTPDFTFDQSMSPIVPPFFNPNATNITITFNGSGDTFSFAGPQLPKNGVNSLTDTALYLEPNLVVGVNSPTNFSGQVGSLGASGPTGDYNGNLKVDAADYVVWRNRLNQSVPAGTGPDGSGNGLVDVADHTFWRSKFGNNAPGSGVPEPASLLALGFIAFIAAARRDRR